MIIVNGELSDSRIAIWDSWLLGDGVFETIRTYGNRPFALDRHLARLAAGAEEIYATTPDLDEIRNSVGVILNERPFQNGKLRIIFGADGNWLLSHDDYTLPNAPARLKSMPYEESAPAQAKRTSYGHRFSMRRRAMADGFDDALLTSHSGLVSEATTCNVIFLIGGEWVTPSRESGCLPGITRELLIENFGLREVSVTLGDLEIATSAALISSLREVHGIASIDSRVYESSNQLSRLQSSFSSWVIGNLAL